MNTSGSLYIGTSGLLLPYKNKNAYPPSLEGFSRMAVYGKLFNSIEVNSIFYKLPRAATVTKWADSVDDGFRFTFKFWKQITHAPALEFQDHDVIKFFQVIAGVNDKVGCILIQFPASIKIDRIGKLAGLLAKIELHNKQNWSIAVEFRSPTWYISDTYALLNRYKMAMVDHDKFGNRSPHPELHADHVYLRFHGPDGNYKGSYDHGFLYEYAGYTSGWAANDKNVYVYFNNTMGAAIQNLKTFEKYYNEFQRRNLDTESTLPNQ
jgi:uncharacterized protein YecE (DUF72 family)